MTALTQAELRKLAGGMGLHTLANDSLHLDVLKGIADTLSASELDLLDGSSTANATASTAVCLDASKQIITSANVGTAGTNCTAVEHGDGFNHTTTITMTSVVATLGDNASLAGGAIIYTLPAGAIVVNSSYFSVGITTTGTPTTDTPEVGLGTLIGSGANATLGAVGAGCENIAGPAVADDIAGTAEVLAVGTQLVVLAGDAHVVHFNWADAWANVDVVAATMTGTVVLNWTFLA